MITVQSCAAAVTAVITLRYCKKSKVAATAARTVVTYIEKKKKNSVFYSSKSICAFHPRPTDGLFFFDFNYRVRYTFRYERSLARVACNEIPRRPFKITTFSFLNSSIDFHITSYLFIAFVRFNIRRTVFVFSVFFNSRPVRKIHERVRVL